MHAVKRSLNVFLCHAHSDVAPVRALYTRLTKDGVDAWLDKEKLLPGQDWELEIRKAVRALYTRLTQGNWCMPLQENLVIFNINDAPSKARTKHHLY